MTRDEMDILNYASDKGEEQMTGGLPAEASQDGGPSDSASIC